MSLSYHEKKEGRRGKEKSQADSARSASVISEYLANTTGKRKKKRRKRGERRRSGR